MNEKKLYEHFKKHWTSYISRVETKRDDGRPDVHLVNNKEQDIFLELKSVDKKFKEAVLPIKKSQFIWHKEYSGRNAYMLFRVEDDFFLFRKGHIFNLRGKVKWTDFKNLAVVECKDIARICNYLQAIGNW